MTKDLFSLSNPKVSTRKFLIDSSELKKIGFKCEITLIQGIRQMIVEYINLKG